MTAPDSNRYALFVDKDENAPPTSELIVDHTRNPFHNQIADDSIPWQEVRKRVNSGPHATSNAGTKTLVIQDKNRTILDRTLVSKNRDRSGSLSTAFTGNSGEKSPDPHENWCGVCSLKFTGKTALLSHIKQMPDHQHYCNLCKRVFKDRNGLKNHVENSLGHEVFCNLCLSAFKDAWGLKNHFENNYQVGHEFVCLTCLLGFRSRMELERHLQTAAKHTWCGSCHRRFRNQIERDEHWQRTMKHKHCLEAGCDFDGLDVAALSEHHRRDHPQCVGCKRILPSTTKLNLHYETCAFALSCPQCGTACAGKAQLSLHLVTCFLCEECGFQTHHEGNFRIHMTKHSNTNIPCWGCDAPMRTYSSLINHLESGRCPKLPITTRLTSCLGRWWYSTLYMDLDLHAQVRTSRINVEEMQQWMDGGLLHPFICRDDRCGKTFGHMSSLVLHCESEACGWDIARLNMPGLETEVKLNGLNKNGGMMH